MPRFGLVVATIFCAAHTVAYAQAVPLAERSNAPLGLPGSSQAAAIANEPDRPITHVFQNLFHDAKRLPSVETALTLGIGGGLALAVHPADDTVTRHATEGGPRQPYKFGSALGNGFTQGGMALGVYAAGLVSDEPSVTHLGSDLIRAQVLNTVLTQGLKFAVQRQRPGSSGGHSYSFPSGHTSSTFATAAVLWRHYGWKAGVPASAIGAWVGAGRVQLGRHFLSDVVFGAALGTVSGRTVTIGHGGRNTVVLAPAAVPGGAALTFALVNR